MHAPAYFLLALLSTAALQPAQASDGAAPAARPAPVKAAPARKAPAGRRPAVPAPSTARLKPQLVAPTKDVLNEHFAVTVTGNVTDANGQPLPGATIWKTNSRDVLAVTNAQGDFTLALPTNAAVTLSCGYAGFEEQQLSLRQPKRLNQFVVSLERAVAAPSR
jgi:hypothetical protein